MICVCVCVSVSNVIPVGLDEDHELVKQFTQRCGGEQKANGWITRSESLKTEEQFVWKCIVHVSGF